MNNRSSNPIPTKESRWQRLKIGLLFTLVAVIIFGGGIVLGRKLPRRSRLRLQQIREGQFVPDKYIFINPLLSCEVAGRKEVVELAPLKSQLLEFIDAKVRAGDVMRVSIYFDTRDGRWLGVNTNEKYFPASLMKVPTMIALLKVAEEHPDILTKKITYHGDFDLNSLEYFKPEKTLRVGVPYTVEELIERMIVYSDNNALPLLLTAIDNKELQEVYTDLGIVIPPEVSDSLVDYMTVKSYASFFRVLYNATYLSRAMSEKALKLLGQSSFKEGLVAGLPSYITVAKKFGERNFSSPPNDRTSQKELHDCGVVYFPSHPYLLCIMTKGKDFERLAKTIKEISRMVYEFQNRQFK